MTVHSGIHGVIETEIVTGVHSWVKSEKSFREKSHIVTPGQA